MDTAVGRVSCRVPGQRLGRLPTPAPRFAGPGRAMPLSGAGHAEGIERPARRMPRDRTRHRRPWARRLPAAKLAAGSHPACAGPSGCAGAALQWLAAFLRAQRGSTARGRRRAQAACVAVFAVGPAHFMGRAMDGAMAQNAASRAAFPGRRDGLARSARGVFRACGNPPADRAARGHARAAIRRPHRLGAPPRAPPRRSHRYPDTA